VVLASSAAPFGQPTGEYIAGAALDAGCVPRRMRCTLSCCGHAAMAAEPAAASVTVSQACLCWDSRAEVATSALPASVVWLCRWCVVRGSPAGLVL